MIKLIIYDNITVNDTEYCQRLHDITDFYNTTATIKTRNITQILTELTDTEWVVVSAIGHIMSCSIESIVDKCRQLNTNLMCHIMYKPQEGHTYMDPQFFVINLAEWHRLGSPAFEFDSAPYIDPTPVLEVSAQMHHGDYTPYWIRAGKGTMTYNATYQQFGAKVIRAFIEDQQTVNNVDLDTRNAKWYLYPNANVQQLQELFTTGNILNRHQLSTQLLTILQEKETLEQTVYILNSEDLYPYIPKTTVEHYIGCASGLKGISLLDTATTTVTYADISSAGLEYQQYLLENWDGDKSSYQQIHQAFADQHPEYRYAWRSWNGWATEIAKVPDIKSAWQRYLNMDHYFLKINLLDPTDQVCLVQHINTINKNFYLWVSNAFNMQYSTFVYGSTTTADRFNILQTQLTNTKLQGVIESSGRGYNINW